MDKDVAKSSRQSQTEFLPLCLGTAACLSLNTELSFRHLSGSLNGIYLRAGGGGGAHEPTDCLATLSWQGPSSLGWDEVGTLCMLNLPSQERLAAL